MSEIFMWDVLDEIENDKTSGASGQDQGQDINIHKPSHTRDVTLGQNYKILRKENLARKKNLLEGPRRKHAAEDPRGGVPARADKALRTVGRKTAPDKLRKRMRRTDDDEIEGSHPMKRARPEALQSDLRRVV
ncbi:hypothetical protein BJY52DRAFT_1191180 [Lactarius psammicola]|nr:hypothetical protein BJY52DRAFT_1191180 [Lactarius psammicola]